MGKAGTQYQKPLYEIARNQCRFVIGADHLTFEGGGGGGGIGD